MSRYADPEIEPLSIEDHLDSIKIRLKEQLERCRDCTRRLAEEKEEKERRRGKKDAADEDVRSQLAALITAQSQRRAQVQISSMVTGE